MTPEVAGRLRDAIAAGVAARFERADIIDATAVRQLALGLLFAGGRRCDAPPGGIAIYGATIEGRVDLDDAADAGGAPLSALKFIGCHFIGGFTARHAHLARLCFDDCIFDGGSDVATIDLTGAQIGSDLGLARIRPADADTGLLWIMAAGSRVDGDVCIQAALLRAPPCPDDTDFGGIVPLAFGFNKAEIAGDILGTGGLRCHGQFGLRSAKVGGDIWLTSASIINHGDIALRLQSAVVAGNVMLNGRPVRRDGTGTVVPFVAEGQVEGFGATIGGTFDLSGAQLRNFDQIAVRLTSATIGKNLAICGQPDNVLTIWGSLDLSLATVNGVFQARYLRIGIDTSPEFAVNLYKASFGSLEFYKLGALVRPNQPGIDPLTFVCDLNATDAVCGTADLNDCDFTGNVRAVRFTCHGDCTLGIEIRGSADFEACTIGGSLDISSFQSRTPPGAPFSLSLKDGTIGRALTLGKTPEMRDRYDLLACRIAPVDYMDGVELIETLWRLTPASEPAKVFQTSFLRSASETIVLDGKSQRLHDAHKKYRARFDTETRASHLVRLFCANLTGEDGHFWPVQSRHDLPDGWRLDPAERDAAAEHYDALEQKWLGEGSLTEARIEGLRLRRAALEEGGIEALADKLAPTFEVDNGVARITTGCLYGARIYAAVFELCRTPDGITVQMQGDTDLSPSLAGTPVLRDRFLEPGTPGAAFGTWLQPPALPGAREQAATALPGLESALRPLLSRTAKIDGIFDLRDLDCDTLQDGGGGAWPEGARLKLNHFTYRKVHWAAAGSDDWDVRRRWLDEQGAEDDYHPQPYEQIIRVARAEGQDGLALNFEIHKQRREYEAALAALSFPFLVAASVCLTLFLFANLRLDAPAAPLVRVLGGIVLFAAIAAAPVIALKALDWGFGFLRRTVQALLTLVVALLVGWLGVAIANDQGRLVVSVSPVAGLVTNRSGGFVVGSERTDDPLRLATDIPCGATISEALYALDVLIPLIDLHQEGRCEVGTAQPLNPARVGAATGALAQVARFTIGNEVFWSYMKAGYAILGWLIVSLSIVTFTQVARRRDGA